MYKLQIYIRFPVHRTPQAQDQLPQDPLSSLRRANEIYGLQVFILVSGSLASPAPAGSITIPSALRRSEPGSHWMRPVCLNRLEDSDLIDSPQSDSVRLPDSVDYLSTVVPMTTVVVPPHQRTIGRVHKPDHAVITCFISLKKFTTPFASAFASAHFYGESI
jgi:hypothetical protein